ncbi:MAG: phospholipid carrier-dependent glycosyltransferase, partial [Gemmataceae bacterium]|nr:phospholipid carrier-dependent glycosyltransferase [Gemmataceae bacterium]
GAAILCLSGEFIYRAGMLTFDGPLGFFVVAALAFGQQAMTQPRLPWRWWLAAGAACGLGMLTKGPVAVVLVVPPLLAWQFLDRRTLPLRPAAWTAFAAMVLLVAGPWFVAVLWRDPAAVGDFFWLHNLRRFVAPLDHAEPVWFYLPSVLVGMLPWSLLLAPCLAWLSRREQATARQRPAALGLIALAAFWCVTFFSLSGCKRAGYLVPAYPLIALLLGAFVTATLRRRSTTLAGFRWLPASGRGWVGVGATVFAVLVVGVQEFLPAYHGWFGLRGLVRGQLDLAQQDKLPIASYPKRWDSIGFYLQRDDVESYTAERRDELIRKLRQYERTLLFVKPGAAMDDLLRALPNDLEFVPRGPQGRTVSSGIVQWRRSE